MSEYQYYEWQTIDRRLTPKEQDAVNRLSSHIDVGATYAQVDYSWGDFKHNPKEVLAQYFDAFFYQANWGSSWLMFRFPAQLLDAGLVEAYCLDNQISLERVGDSYILDIRMDEEESGDGIDPDGKLGGLLPLRNAILQGDYRSLYLLWLRVVSENFEWEYDEELQEPPLPPGLDHLDAPLSNLVDLFGIDEHLIQAATTGAPALPQSPSAAQKRRAIGQLPREECDDFLLRLLEGEPLLQMNLQRRLEALLGKGTAGPSAEPRLVIDLFHARDAAKEADRARQTALAAEKKQQHLEALAGQQEAKWKEVIRLIESSNAQGYDQAVIILRNLRDLAEYKQESGVFQIRLSALHEKYSRRSALRQRLRRAGLE